jgi:hypothetical protein
MRGAVSGPVAKASFYSVFPPNLLAMLCRVPVCGYRARDRRDALLARWALGASLSPAASYGEAAHDVLTLRI